MSRASRLNERVGAADVSGLAALRLAVLTAAKQSVYGDSYTGEPGPMATSGKEAHKQTAAALGLASTSFGVGGYPISQTVQKLLNGNALNADGGAGTRTGQWVPAEDKLVLIDAGKNDNLYTNGLNAVTTNAITHGYRAALALLRCSSRVEQDDASIAYGGASVTWDTFSDANAYSGGSTKRAQGTVANATVTITLPGPGTYWLFGSLWDNTALNKTTPTAWAVTLDGAAQTSWSLPLVKVSRASFNWTCPTAYKVVATGAGTHTVVLSAVGTSTWATFDCYALEKTEKPVVIVRKQVDFAAYSWGGGGGGGGTNAGVNAVNDALQTVAGEFDNVYVSDATGSWVPATHVGSDNLHPNDAGMAVLAAADVRAAYKAVRGMLTGRGARTHPLAGKTTTIFDSFNRADTSNGLGTTEVGSAAWTAVSGTWGVSSNAAYTSAVTAQGIATVTAVADCAVSARIVLAGGSGLIFRCSDSSNYFMWDGSELWVKNAGAFTSLAKTGNYRVVGTRLTAVLSGSLIRLYADDTLVAEYVSTFNQTVTKHGLLSANSTTTRMSHFKVMV